MRCAGQTTSSIGPFQYSERRTAAVLKHHMKSLCNASNGSVPVRTKRDRAYAIPTGSVFVSESVLKGVLPQVLDEMLSTRAMLKKAAKEYKKRVPNLSPAVLRQIEARQLALKYVANVTYGYTSATFSGRSAVPLVADAIVVGIEQLEDGVQPFFLHSFQGLPILALTFLGGRALRRAREHRLW